MLSKGTLMCICHYAIDEETKYGADVIYDQTNEKLQFNR